MAIVGAKLNAPTDTMFSTRSRGAGLEMRERLLHEEHRTMQVHLVGLRERVRRHLAERLRQGVGGVVHHDVDAAELGDRGFDENVEMIEVARVRGYANGLPTQPAQVLSRLLTGLGLAAGHHDSGPGKDEALGQRQPDAAGTSRHDDGAVGHVEQCVERRAIHARQ